jgi:hypothetical protein
MATIVSKLSTFSMPASSVPIVKQAITAIYFAQGTALDNEVARIHTTVLQLLPTEAHSRASSRIDILGDDASQHIPTVLRQVLTSMTEYKPILSTMPPSAASSTWTSAGGCHSTEFPELPSIPKTQEVWKLGTKAAPTPPPLKPVSIRLPMPITAAPPSSQQIMEASTRAFNNRTRLPEQIRCTIPDIYRQVEDSIVYD